MKQHSDACCFSFIICINIYSETILWDYIFFFGAPTYLHNNTTAVCFLGLFVEHLGTVSQVMRFIN